MMILCEGVYINGDHQNGFTVGIKSNGLIPTKIEEFQTEYKNGIDREWLVWCDKKLIASISNVPVLAFYINEEKNNE